MSVTLEQYMTMLRARGPELTYTDTGSGWSLSNTIRLLPVDEVMAILLGQYAAGAQLTGDMISAIDWLHPGETTDFRRTSTGGGQCGGAARRRAARRRAAQAYPRLPVYGPPPRRRCARV